MITSKLIISTIEATYGVSIQIDKGSRSKGEMKIPRMMAIKMMRDILKLSFPAIALRVSGIRPESVTHSYRRIGQILEEDSRLCAEYHQLVDLVLASHIKEAEK